MDYVYLSPSGMDSDFVSECFILYFLTFILFFLTGGGGATSNLIFFYLCLKVTQPFAFSFRFAFFVN